MKDRPAPTPVTWTIPDAGRSGQTRTVAGLDYGGDGPPILLHHANGFCAGMWGLVAPALTARYRVLAMDARGHGDSDPCAVPEEADWSFFAEDVVQVASAIARTHGVERLPLGIGSSFGGIVSAAAESRSPGLFERLVLLDPPFFPSNKINAAFGLPPPKVEGDERREFLVTSTKKRRREWPSADALYEAWKDKPLALPWAEGGLELYLTHGFREADDGTMHLKCDPAVEGHIFATTGQLDPVDFGPGVSVPLHMVRARGGHSPDGFLEALCTFFPEAAYHEIDGGHLLPLEVPEACVELIESLAG